MTKIKWLCEYRSMLSCGTVRGVVPAAQINVTSRDRFTIDVKSTNEVYFSDFAGYDVLVMQRVIGEHAQDICRRGRWNYKLKVVYDIDDALWLLPKTPSDPNFKTFQTMFPEKAQECIHDMMKNEVDHVVCSTPELAEEVKAFTGNDQVTVVENCVDPQFFYKSEERKEKKTFDLVWYAACGHNSNGVLLDTIFGTLLSEFPQLRLHLIGAPQSFESLRGLAKFGNRVDLKDWVLYTNLGDTIRGYDVALCPIFDYPFTRCKSELKPIESAMAGLIPVMSDCPQFRRYGNRILSETDRSKLVLPNDPEAWITTLRELINGTYVPPMREIQEKTIETYGVGARIKDWCSFYDSLFKDARAGLTPKFML